MSRLALAFLLSIAAGPASAAQDVGPYAFTLTGKSFDERCLTLAAGQSIRYRFSASAPVDFNIHYHRGKEVFYPVRRSGVRDAEGTFRAQEADDYCLMWEHAGSGSAAVTGSFEPIPAR